MLELPTNGHIEVICGPMFSGKTEEFMRRIRRAKIARQKIQIFKPKIDTRYDNSRVVSHNKISEDASVVENPSIIRDSVNNDTQVVGVDEAQFFDTTIVKYLSDLADRGIRVIVAGLDTDYRGKPFEGTLYLIAQADFVTKLQAICMVCGKPASKTARAKQIETQEDFVLGSDNIYRAMCRKHWCEHIEGIRWETGDL
jgi:thymidine kinase